MYHFQASLYTVNLIYEYNTRCILLPSWDLCYTCILNQDIVTKSLLILLFLRNTHPPPPPSSSHPSKKPKISRFEEELNEHDDPGCIFIFSSDAEVHQVLGLPAVATLSPSLQQGKNKKVTSLLL